MSSRKVKVIGAGSIGNHLSNAARAVGWDVFLCDIDEKALERTRTEIYPGRYGKWDDAIQLCKLGDEPRGGFDIICIGTPPDVHVPLMRVALKEEPRLILVEKPVCGPMLEQLPEFAAELADSATKVCVGYDHVLAPGISKVRELVEQRVVGEPVTLDAEFREHWGGIFKAHPWLEGPWQTYLGYWKRGGGSGGEHSHATNMWQHWAHLIGAGRITDVSALVVMKQQREAEYDELFALHVKTENGFYGRIIQDVVTAPTRKWVRLQCRDGAIEWRANQGARGDVVAVIPADGSPEETFDFPKTRPDDFICEMRHLDDVIEGRVPDSPTSLSRGLDTMLVVAAGYASGAENCHYLIDYERGHSRNALRPA